MKIYLNLASQPSRRRRPFFFLFGLLLILGLITFFGSFWLFFNYQTEARAKRQELIRIARREDALRREEKQWAARSATLSKNLAAEVELANSIIQEKAFSWSDFFSRLERALPPACYLQSLSFQRQSEMKLEIKFRLVAPDLKAILTTMDNLREEGFSGMRVQSENLSGQSITAEMVMNYERNN